MEFRKIEYFLKAVQTMNFTEAARQLYISPQALTQQIVQLEEELGYKLFHRNTRKISLTEFGVFCYQQFSPVKVQYDKAVEQVKKKALENEKIIRVGFFNALPKKDIVNPWINMLQETLPEYEFEVISADGSTILKYLDSDKIDICLTTVDNYFISGDLELIKIKKTVSGKVVVSERHPWASKRTVTEEELEHADMLQLKGEIELSNDKSVYNRIKCRNIRIVTDFDAMLALLERGKSFAMFPNLFQAQADVKLCYLTPPDIYKMDFHVVCAIKKNKENPKLTHLLQYLKENNFSE